MNSQQPVEQRLTNLETKISQLEQAVHDLSRSRGAAPAPSFTPAQRPAIAVPPKSMRFKATELEIGQKWLSVAGVILLFLGILFFVSYVFRYVGPSGKVLLSYAVSLGLFAAAFFTHKKYAFFSSVVAAGAWGVAYLTTYSAHFFVATRIITSPLVALYFLALVVVLLLITALWQKSRALVALALVLGYLTMILSPLSLFSIIGTVLIVLIGVVLALSLPWGDFVFATALGGYISYYFWFANVAGRLPAQGGGLLEKNLLGLIAVMVMWAAVAVGLGLRRDKAESMQGRVDLVTLLIASLATTMFGVGAVQVLMPGNERAAVAALLLVLSGLHAAWALMHPKRQEQVEAVLTAGVLSLVFGMASIAMLFPDNSSGVSITWAALGLLLAAAGMAWRRPNVALLSLLPFIGATIRFMTNDLYEGGTITETFPADIITGVITSAALIGGVVITRSLFKLKDVPTDERARHIPGALLVMAIVVLFSLVSHEFVGALPTVIWGVLGLIVVVVSFITRWRDGRLLGLAALGVTVARMFLHDLQGLEVLARVVSFMVLGGILLLLAYGYNYNKEKLQRYLEEE